MRTIETLLVANRGEIARRVFRACRTMGIRSAAIYSDVDEGSAWSRAADLGVPLGGVSPTETYLDIEKVLAAAKSVGADAIHPGYGFLSENADFAEACAEAGIIFVGPSPDAMRALGSKVNARAAAERAGVPVIPGLDGAGRSTTEMEAEASKMGYPVLVKASAGGGGRGMRVVDRAEDFASAYRAARAEAASSFGDDHLLVERYFPESRHIEVQVLGDETGRVLHLFERECSVQRRHQKIIEESPSPNVTTEMRQAMTDAAVALAQEVGYASAGTVEFLVDLDGGFYLLEMNTRLQVEHPVTELVTGVDLVAEQIRVAQGLPISFEQSELTQRGHAIECRVYAEDPSTGFLPSIGRLQTYRRPTGPGIRCDDGVSSGAEITPHYDAMIAKVIAQGWDRPAALRRMRLALADTVALGVTTNLPYLRDLVKHPAFEAGETTTSFIERHFSDWQAMPQMDDALWLAMAAFESLSNSGGTGDAETESGLRFAGDPWSHTEAWRNLR